MALLLDSFWRALAYCLHPRVVWLSMLPLLCMGGLATLWGYFYWDSSVQWVRTLPESSGLLKMLWSGLVGLGLDLGPMPEWVASLLVIVGITPVIAVLSLLIVALSMTPILVNWVGQRRFATLERCHGASWLSSLAWSLGSTLLALLVLLVSTPLWLIPPLVLVVPPLIWGWLTYRVMAFDAWADHAAAPAIVWASGVVFAAAFMVLIPLAIWIYTLVFAFSSLWFCHFCLAALQQLRANTPTVSSQTPESISL